MKILVIEDEQDLIDIIAVSLEKEGYLVECAINLSSGMQKIIDYEYDCILLDIMLPDGNGLTLIEEVKAMGKEVNVIIISAKDSLDDKVYGLNLGADDYLLKPFHIAELTARINSVVRRKILNGSSVLEFCNLKLDLQNRTASTNNSDIALNRKEFDIISYLVLNKNRLVNKAALAERVWGNYIDESDDFEFMYAQIKNLRKKLRCHHINLEIQSIYGIGYKITANEAT
jgi:DNA-binding response OmpR family regulator